MKLKNFQFIYIVLFAIFFFIVNESLTYYIGFHKARQESYEENRLIFQNFLDAQANNIEIIADILSHDDSIIQGYLNNDPESIKKHITPIWNKVKSDNFIYEIHFFKPPAESFVNFSNFNSIGKDVSNVRSDIVWVTSSFEKSTHALMCKTYAGLRATSPIIDANGNLLGGLSLGKKIDWIPEAVKNKTKLEAFLVYKKDATHSLTKKYYERFMQNKELLKDHILANSTLNLSVQDIKDIDFTKNIQALTVEGKTYTLFLYEIIDFNKHTLAHVCVLTQLKKFNERFWADFVKDFILIFLTALIILFITRRSLIKLLKQVGFLKNLTEEIKIRNFTSLSHDSQKINFHDTALSELKENIKEMGIELQKQYTILENENIEKNKQLIIQLHKDTLTNLGNRNALFKDLEQDKQIFIAAFNIRAFRDINDAFGFDTGNRILKILADEFSVYTQKYNLKAYRIGSDEFVVINQEKMRTKDFENYIKELIDNVEGKIFRSEDEKIDLRITLYAGICFEEKGRLKKADTALTQAKKENKEYVIYSSQGNTKEYHLENIRMLHKIDVALIRDQIIVYYQAIVDRNEKIIKYEALVRMQDGEDILTPYHFLEISKKSKNYSKITKVVIAKAFHKFKNEEQLISINVTADDILNKEVRNYIYKKLDECKDTNKVVFELIESDDLYNLTEVEKFIYTLKEKGAKIAIDDFGTGYSNFSYMMKIKPDYLKIDGSLIKNLNTDKNAYKIVTTIVNFAHALDIKIVAEFVHSQEIFLLCKEIGVDEFQGYYFSKPQAQLLE